METVPDPATHPTMEPWPAVGRALGISRSSVYAGIAAGEIPSIRIGRRIVVPTAALRRLLQLDEPTTVS